MGLELKGRRAPAHFDPEESLEELAELAASIHSHGLINNLVVALKHNAFGDHFLSDLFSAGHMRVARRQMFDQLRDDKGTR